MEESFGSTAMARSAPMRSWPMMSLKRENPGPARTPGVPVRLNEIGESGHIVAPVVVSPDDHVEVMVVAIAECR